MKKLVAILLAAIVLCTVLGLVSCNRDEFADYRKPQGFSYYRQMTMNADKKLYVFNHSESLTREQKIAAEAIQGIYARTNAKYYYWRSGNYVLWLDDMVQNYGFTTQDVTFAEMVDSFKQE